MSRVKSRVVFALSAVLLSLLTVPVINILSAPRPEDIKWQERSFLYNMDFVASLAAKVLYPLGISIAPKQVVIGHDGWLYLGDKYAQTLSVDRRPAAKEDFKLGQRIGAATEAWDAYLSSKGVKLFRIMIGPNKGTIYPEHLPDWAKPASPNATDALLTSTGKKLYIDLRGPLLDAKAQQSPDLYYKTDTHWNYLGAGIAFRAFAQEVGAATPELRWPTSEVYEPTHAVPRAGGDLARFLRLSTSLPETEWMTLAQDLPVKSTTWDFDTQQVLPRERSRQIRSPLKPLLTQSVGAMNKQRVLWLTDSYGSALSSLMTATFSDVLQLHWGEAIKPEGRLVQLVEDWKPDYVFVTVVERSARDGLFTTPPPVLFRPNGPEFTPVKPMSTMVVHDLVNDRPEHGYRVNGTDPFITFALAESATPEQASHLSMDLSCGDGTASVPIQLFWYEKGDTRYMEEHSARFSLRTGRNLIDLRTLPGWKRAKPVSHFRLDIESPDTCVRFRLNAPSLGLLGTAIK